MQCSWVAWKFAKAMNRRPTKWCRCCSTGAKLYFRWWNVFFSNASIEVVINSAKVLKIDLERFDGAEIKRFWNLRGSLFARSVQRYEGSREAAGFWEPGAKPTKSTRRRKNWTWSTGRTSISWLRNAPIKSVPSVCTYWFCCSINYLSSTVRCSTWNEGYCTQLMNYLGAIHIPS